MWVFRLLADTSVFGGTINERRPLIRELHLTHRVLHGDPALLEAYFVCNRRSLSLITSQYWFALGEWRMPLDQEMAEIAQVFFAECRENLDVMESGLLRMDSSDDVDNVNTVFRAAHSI